MDIDNLFTSCVPNPPPLEFSAFSAQAGSVSSFIDPERSTTRTMSRGIHQATAVAVESNWPDPNIRPKNVFSWVTSGVTRTAFPPARGVNVRSAGSQTPISMLLRFRLARSRLAVL